MDNFPLVTFAGKLWFVDSIDKNWARIWRTHFPYPRSMGETEWLNVRIELLDADEVNLALNQLEASL